MRRTASDRISIFSIRWMFFFLVFALFFSRTHTIMCLCVCVCIGTKKSRLKTIVIVCAATVFSCFYECCDPQSVLLHNLTMPSLSTTTILSECTCCCLHLYWYPRPHDLWYGSQTHKSIKYENLVARFFSSLNFFFFMFSIYSILAFCIRVLAISAHSSGKNTCKTSEGERKRERTKRNRKCSEQKCTKTQDHEAKDE